MTMMAECGLATDLVRCSILMLLYEKPCHGYGIIEALQLRLERRVSPGLIYPFLSELLNARYLSSKQETVRKRERILYSMTPRGRKLAESVFRRLSQIVSSAIQPSLLDCAHCGCKLYEPGHVEEIDGRKVIFCCVYCAGAYRHGRDSTSP